MNRISKYLAGAVFSALSLTTLAGQTTYTVSVDVDSAGNIKYAHQSSSGHPNGAKGSQIAVANDVITWQCTGMCQSVHVLFEREHTPCNGKKDDLYNKGSQGTSLPCTISVGAATDGTFKTFSYNIAVYWSAGTSGPSGLALDDPDVIVDNNAVVELSVDRRKAGSKSAPKKQK